MRFFRYEYEVENNFLKSTYRVAADFAEIGKDDKSSLPICCTLCYTLEKSKKFGELQKYERGDVCPIGLKNWSIWTIFISFKTINQLIVFHALTALGTKNNVHSVSTDLLIMSGLWFKCMHLGDRRKLLGKWLVLHALTKIRLAEGNEEA